VREILKYWDLEESDVVKITDTTWKVDERYFLKHGQDEGSIFSNVEILKTLDKNGFPVALPVPTVIGKDYICMDNAFYMLTNKLEGEHLDIRTVLNRPELAFKIGMIIAKLQQGLLNIKEDFGFYDNNLLMELDGWIKDEVTTKASGYYAYETFEFYSSKLHQVYPSLLRQPIHRDVHLGNMLFEGDVLVGYIDFDISQINARIFDIAYMATGVLAEIFSDLEYRHKWIGFYNSLVEGFQAVAPLDEVEKQSIPLLMASIEILFVAYFLSKEDAESARLADSVLKWLADNGVILPT